MSTIQFENGTKVQFDGNPTEADVNEVAQRIGLNGGGQTTPAQSTANEPGDFLQTIFPNKNLGKVVGTALGVPLTLAQSGVSGLKHYDYNPHTTPGEVFGDLAGDAINAGSLLIAPETGGTSLLARMGVNAGIGGGLSLSHSLSSGQSLKDSNTWKDAGGSALLSSLLPVLAKPLEALSGATKAASGVTPQVETILKDTTPDELRSYIDTTLGHNKDLNKPTAIGLASSKVEKVGETIKKNLSSVGQQIGEALKIDGGKPIGLNPESGNNFIDEVLSNFNKKLEDTFGHEVTYSPADKTQIKIGGEVARFDNSEEPQLLPMKGRARTITPADQKRILDIHNQVSGLAESPTISKASDIVHNLDDLVDWTKRDQFGVSHDPLEGILASTRGQLNASIRQTSPSIAEANNRYANLKRLEEGLGTLAGKDLQRGSLLMQRVFSGDKSAETVKLMQDIKNETGIDLVKDAGLAKFATENFGDASSKTLLQQALNMEGSLAGGLKRALLSPIKATTKALVVPDTEKYAMKLAGGGKYANRLDELLNSPSGRGFLRTYLNNISADHPEIGKFVGRSFSNLVGNATGN